VEEGGMDWIDLAQDKNRWRALGKVIISLRVPKYAGNFLTRCEPVSFSRTQVPRNNKLEITRLILKYTDTKN
jgi:hypothetical protein